MCMRRRKRFEKTVEFITQLTHFGGINYNSIMPHTGICMIYDIYTYVISLDLTIGIKFNLYTLTLVVITI